MNVVIFCIWWCVRCTCARMETLPPELITIIASTSPALFVSCAGYAKLLDCQHTKYDIMIAHGYSVEITHECIVWRRNGKLHRTDGPAYVDIYGNEDWYYNGDRHRIGGPAATTQYGYRYYFEYGRHIRTEPKHCNY